VIIPIFSFGKKNQITPINQNYLSKHNIPFQPLETKKQLYEKIKFKKLLSVFKTDEIANLHGHEVLRTPVRHCELNPIELIWAQVKGFVSEIIRKRTVFSANKFTEVKHRVHNYNVLDMNKIL
jgi:hypothetical protein